MNIAKLFNHEKIRENIRNLGFLTTPEGVGVSGIFPENDWYETATNYDKEINMNMLKEKSDELMKKYKLITIGDNRSILPTTDENKISSISISWVEHKNGCLYIPILGVSGGHDSFSKSENHELSYEQRRNILSALDADLLEGLNSTRDFARNNNRNQRDAAANDTRKLANSFLETKENQLKKSIRLRQSLKIRKPTEFMMRSYKGFNFPKKDDEGNLVLDDELTFEKWTFMACSEFNTSLSSSIFFNKDPYLFISYDPLIESTEVNLIPKAPCKCCSIIYNRILILEKPTSEDSKQFKDQLEYSFSTLIKNEEGKKFLEKLAYEYFKRSG